MDTNQIIIKVLLIAVFAVAAIAIVFPGRGARGQAIRRIFWVLGLLVGIVAIAVPELTSAVANWFGIGRGTDLLLYLLIVFAVGYVVTVSAHSRKSDRTITVLARKVALMEAELRKSGAMRFEATVAKGNESMFDETGPIELPVIERNDDA